MNKEVYTNDDPERTCSDCGTLLVNDKGVSARDIIVMDFNLYCLDCLEGRGILALHKKGKDVRRELWYINS